MVDAAAILMKVLQMESTDSAVSHHFALRLALGALRVEVGTRIWTPEKPNSAEFPNTSAGIVFAGVPGDGPDENCGDQTHSFVFTCYGGTTDETASGYRRPRLAGECEILLGEVLAQAVNVRTTYGLLVSTRCDFVGEWMQDLEAGWPCYRSQWTVVVGK